MALHQAGRVATTTRDALETVRAEHDRGRAAHERAASTVTVLTDRIEELRSVALPAGAGDLDTAVVSARERWQAARRVLEAAETTLTRARSAVAGLPERSAITAQLRTVTAYETTLGQVTALRGRRQSAAEQHAAAAASSAEARAARQLAADVVERVRGESVAADLRPHLQVGHACPVCAQTVTSSPPAGRPRAGRRPDRTAGSRAAARARPKRRPTVCARRLTALDTQVSGAAERLFDLDHALVADLPGHPGGSQRDPSRDRAVLADLEVQIGKASEQERATTADRDTARTALQHAEDEGARLAAATQQGWADFHATNGRLTALGAPTVTAETLGAAWSALLSWADTLTTDLTTSDLPAARSALDIAEATVQGSAERLRAGIADDHAARETLTAATLADDKARSELAALTTRIAERAGAAERSARCRGDPCPAGRAPATGRSRRPWLGRWPTGGRWPVSRPRPYGTVGGPSSRPHGHCCCRCGTGSPDSAVPALDADDLPRAWAEMAWSWAGRQAGERRADLTDLATTLERLDGELRSAPHSRQRSARRAHDRPPRRGPTHRSGRGGADGPDPHPGGAASSQRARATTGSIVRRRSAADRLQTTIATDNETEQVSRLLQRLMSAKRFPQWLAEALDPLLVDGASRILAGELSQGQYDLVHDKGEFFRGWTTHDAGLRRGVRTLSGGETFQAVAGPGAGAVRAARRGWST